VLVKQDNKVMGSQNVRTYLHRSDGKGRGACTSSDVCDHIVRHALAEKELFARVVCRELHRAADEITIICKLR
jgi:hypothetical protein